MNESTQDSSKIENLDKNQIKLLNKLGELKGRKKNQKK
jgi:hypothetical protein